MKALEEKILKEGEAIGTEIVKVDGFLNHRIDAKFMDEMGEEFARLFADEKPEKILTVEASGIAIACSAARSFGYIPVVFAKKAAPNTMTEDFYAAEAKSFTKGTVSVLRVAKKYIEKGDKVLILDDFLASGEAGIALCEIVRSAGAEIAGFGAAVEKRFQGGAERLRSLGIKVKSLAVIDRIEDGRIVFGTDKMEEEYAE